MHCIEHRLCSIDMEAKSLRSPDEQRLARQGLFVAAHLIKISAGRSRDARFGQAVPAQFVTVG